MIQTADSSRIYLGNNSTVTPYPLPFLFHDEEHLVVAVRDVDGVEDLQLLGTDYTVLGEGDHDGGSITTTWPVPATSHVSIVRNVPITQLTSYEEGDSFPAKSHEAALDKLTMICQQNSRVTGSGAEGDLAQAFRLTDASVGINAVAKVNDTMLGINALGEAILRPPGDLMAWMGQGGTAWQNTEERLGTRGAYAGQLGVQIDSGTIYIANSVTPGDWFPFLIGTGIVGATNGMPYLLDPPAGDLVGTDEAQTLYNKTLESPTIHSPAGLTKNDVGLGNVDNTSDISKPISAATGAAMAYKEDKAEKGLSGGYASLDGGGKVPLAQIPDAVLGASQYKGTWNASTNSPSITTGSAPGKTGWYYAVAVAGTTTVDGISSWAVGDQIISNGVIWQRIVNVSAVSSVNSKTGAVVLVPSDLGLGNVDNTSDATKNAASATLTNKTINGANNTLTVRLDADVTNNLPVSRLNNGTGAAGTTWWCGDGSWKQPPGTGDISGPAGSNDGELVLYSGTTGKVVRRFSGTSGFAKASATGVLTTQATISAADVDGAFISGQTDKDLPDHADTLIVRDSVSGNVREMLVSHAAHFSTPRSYIAGCKLDNNVTDAANDIDVGSGICRDATDTVDIHVAAVTKRIDAVWAAGTNQGGRDTGATADGSWRVFAIWNPTTYLSDVLFSLSDTPTMPSGFTYKRRIGSIYRIGAVIRNFTQLGDYFQFSAPVASHSAATLAQNSSFLASLAGSTGSIPAGKKFLADVQVSYSHSAGASLSYCHDPDTTQPALYSMFTAVSGVGHSFRFSVWCNTSAQIRIASGAQAGTFTYTVQPFGYWDLRGAGE